MTKSVEEKVWCKFPILWEVLHVLSFSGPNKMNDKMKNNIIDLFDKLFEILECYKCSKHLIGYIENNPIEDHLNDKYTFSKYLCSFHNDINKNLNNYQQSISESYEYFKNNNIEQKLLRQYNINIKELYDNELNDLFSTIKLHVNKSCTDDKVIFEVFNNAFSSLKFPGSITILFDPWMKNNLYEDHWAPFPYVENTPESFFGNHCFISHIHEDHWDMDTISKFNKDCNFIIPNIFPNFLIQKKLKANGFNNVEMYNIETWYTLHKDIEFFIIPPLNSSGQEDKMYEKDKIITGIDCGIIIKSYFGNFLLLGDNTPYEDVKLQMYLEGLDINVFCFPFNGIADDFPLCYDNLTINEKKELSLKRCNKRHKVITNVINKIKPTCCIPYSSDFILNGHRRDEFIAIHPIDFLLKDEYVNKLSNDIEYPCYSLLYGDKLNIYSKKIHEYEKVNLKRSEIPKNFIPEICNINNNINNNKNDIEPLINKAAENLFNKLTDKQLESIGDWKLVLNLTDLDKIYTIDLKNKIVEDKQCETYYLQCNLTSEMLKKHLNFELHWNNSEIGMYLSWIRNPNEFNPVFYYVLNFFHAPIQRK